MGRSIALAAGLAAAILLGGASTGARAQCRLCTNPTTQLEEEGDSGPIQLQVDTTLDFDRLVMLGSGDGAVALLPNGERSASGSVATVSGAAMVGSITVSGEPGRALRVELPRRIELHSLEGGEIVIDDVETDLPGLPMLDSAGKLTFRLGGRLKLGGDSEGEYRGDIPITVDYL